MLGSTLGSPISETADMVCVDFTTLATVSASEDLHNRWPLTLKPN